MPTIYKANFQYVLSIMPFTILFKFLSTVLQIPTPFWNTALVELPILWNCEVKYKVGST